MNIRAIIFDLGGVLLRTSDLAPREQLAARLGMSRRDLEELIFGRESGNQAQRGEITVKQHWSNLCLELNCSPEQLQAVLDEFFAYDVFDFDLLDTIRELHKQYKTGLLSNAWDDMRQLIAEKWHFEDAFDDIIISAEVKLAKPDRRIFQLALQRLDVAPDEAVFIDDWQPNIRGAEAVGLHAIHFTSADQMKHELEQLLDSHEH